MKVYVLIQEDTAELFGVYPTYDDAKAIGDWETQKAQDWVDSLRETGENVVGWVPNFYIEETEFHQ